MLNSFPNPDFLYNIGGCELFKFIPVCDVDFVELNFSLNTVLAISLKPGKEFFTGYASFNSLQFRERIRNNDSGNYFLTEITGFYPKLSQDALRLFSEMQHKEFVVILADNNRNKRLVGSPETPVIFTFDQSTGRSPSQRNGFDFRFNAQLQHPSPFYNIM